MKQVENLEIKRINWAISTVNWFIDIADNIAFESENDKTMYIASLKTIISYLEIYKNNSDKNSLSINLDFLFNDGVIHTFKKYLWEEIITLQSQIRKVIISKKDRYIARVEEQLISWLEWENIEWSNLFEIITIEWANKLFNLVNKKNDFEGWWYQIKNWFWMRWKEKLSKFNITEIKIIKRNNSLILIGQNWTTSKFIILWKIDRNLNIKTFDSRRSLSSLEYNEKLWYLQWFSNYNWSSNYFFVDLDTLDSIFDISEINQRSNGSISWMLEYRVHSKNPWILLYDKNWKRLWKTWKILEFPTNRKIWAA